MSEEFVKTIASLIGISAMAAASRMILSEEKRSFSSFARGTALAVFAGGVVGSLIQDQGFSPAFQGGVVGLVAFVADDLLMLVLNVTRTLRNNPEKIIDRILDMLPSRNRGVSSNDDTDIGTGKPE